MDLIWSAGTVNSQGCVLVKPHQHLALSPLFSPVLCILQRKRATVVSALHSLFGDLSLTDMSRTGVLGGQTRASTSNLSACGGDESYRELQVTRFTDGPAFREVNTPFAAEDLSHTSPGSSTGSPRS